MQSNRRERSLGLLCVKFLKLYPYYINESDNILISIEEIIVKLEVERRRVYDIVNVLESIEVLTKSAKNKYLWHGFNNIRNTLIKLKTLAIKSDFLEYTKSLMASQLDLTVDLHCDKQQATCIYSEPQTTFSLHHTELKDSSIQTINISRDEKSLGIMSQKFLMLFLTSEDGLVTIHFAARVLLGDTKNDITEHGKYKTKIRRLYDIANVLINVGLIRKHSMKTTKSAYKYIGPDVQINRDAEYVYNFMNQGNPKSNSKHSLFDHFKRNLDLKCIIPKFDINTGILKSEKEIKIEPITIILPDLSQETKKENQVQQQSSQPCEITNYNSQIDSYYYDGLLAINSDNQSQFSPSSLYYSTHYNNQHQFYYNYDSQMEFNLNNRPFTTQIVNQNISNQDIESSLYAEKRRKFTNYTQPIDNICQLENIDQYSSSSPTSSIQQFQFCYEFNQQIPSINTVLE